MLQTVHVQIGHCNQKIQIEKIIASAICSLNVELLTQEMKLESPVLPVNVLSLQALL